MLKKILIQNFQDAQNISGSFGIHLPNNVGHIRKVSNFQFYSQKCWALWKNPTDPNNNNNNNNNKAVWEFKKFKLIILGRLLKLKIGFIAAQNLKQHRKMFRSFLS
jgi:hypothetical protein